MKRLIPGCLVALLMVFVAAFQAQSANPMMDAVKAQWTPIKGFLLKTAVKVPDEVWAFKATPEVRTFAQILGHIVDSQVLFCSTASGEKGPQLNAEKTMTTKAQLSKALEESTAFCDKVIAGMDDKKGLENIKFFIGGSSPRALILSFNTGHSYEHYGNLVTYMRLNKIVPPSSEPSPGRGGAN
ncbi:MAG: DinB family protein [Acidobacteria bacterium]|nr:DinB family protein [Acidobacteriota bacterium]